jgi:EmrB/QacA subfamily drug resistance transporter
MSGAGNDASALEAASSSPRLVVLILALVLFMAALDQTVVGTALPRIAAEIGGLDWYSWVFAAYLVTTAAVTPVAGKLGDIYGRRRLLAVGIVEFVLSSLLAGLAPSMEALVVMRALQGVGAGMLAAGALAALGDLFPPAKLGKYNGMMSGVYALASLIGPILGGLITDLVGWRWVFLINLPVGAFALVVVLRRFHPPTRGRVDAAAEPLDVAGAALLILTLVAALLGISGLERVIDGSFALAVGGAAAAIVFGALFIRVERRAAAPILPLELLGNSELRRLLALTVVSGAAIYAVGLFTPLLLQGPLGLSPSAAGLAMTPLVFALVGGGVVGGVRLSRTGRYRRALLVGFVLAAAGASLLAVTANSPTVALICVALGVVGAGAGISVPLLVSAAQNAVSYAQLGLATSLSKSARTLGGVIGIGALGSALTLLMIGALGERVPAALGGADEALQRALARDPSAILSGDPARALAELGVDPGRIEALLEALRGSLAAAIGGLGWIVAGLLGLAALASLGLVGLPLREGFAEPVEPVEPENPEVES